MPKTSKNIVIFSEDMDPTTTLVMQWVLSLDFDVIRINKDDPNFQIVYLSTECVKIKTTYRSCLIKKGDVFWFRRAGAFSVFYTGKKNEKDVNSETFCFLERQEAWRALIYWGLRFGKCLDNPFKADVNKLDVLIKAEDLGIQIPAWILTGSRKELRLFAEKYDKIATKNFTTLQYTHKKKAVKILTGCLFPKDISNVPISFSPMIFQQYIEKKYELRCFLLCNRLYSMAIFSQQDDKTRIDFRNYNTQNPNRCHPYQLPLAIEKKIIRLAHLLGLDTASFDILIDRNDNLYFLEVNPVGQFGMVSYPCNYNLEKKIAEHLVSLANGL